MVRAFCTPAWGLCNSSSCIVTSPYVTPLGHIHSRISLSSLPFPSRISLSLSTLPFKLYALQRITIPWSMHNLLTRLIISFQCLKQQLVIEGRTCIRLNEVWYTPNSQGRVKHWQESRCLAWYPQGHGIDSEPGISPTYTTCFFSAVGTWNGAKLLSPNSATFLSISNLWSFGSKTFFSM